jgi:hypothetical protein
MYKSCVCQYHGYQVLCSMLTCSPGSTSDSGTVETWRPRPNLVPNKHVSLDENQTVIVRTEGRYNRAP